MKRSLIITFMITVLAATGSYSQAEKQDKKSEEDSRRNANVAIVVDERLALLLTEPSLYAVPIQRMRRGRNLLVLRSKEADGVTFYEVKTSPNSERTGWVQAEAVIGNFQRNDDNRLVQLVQASSGFAQVERAVFFLAYFPESPLRPSILLLLGDLVEEEALVLSKKASEKLNRREMAASGAPLHSFYLNYSGLDRYRKLGIRFLFNINTRTYHYDGATWFELVAKFPKSQEAAEAGKRLDFLKEKMAREN